MALTKASYSMITGASVNVLDFGAVGDGVTDNAAYIQAAINYASSNGIREVYFPAGNYLINSGLTMPGQMSLCGVPSSLSSTLFSNKPSKITAGTADITMLFTSGSDITLRDLSFNGAEIASTCFHASNDAQIVLHYYTNCNFIGAKEYGVRLKNVGGINALNLQVANAKKIGVFMEQYCGDADWNNVSVFYCDVDNTSTAIGQPGVGVLMGAGCNNSSWRGGKIEYNRIGMVIADTQGINISNVNFDVNRLYSIAIDDNFFPPDGADEPLAGRSISIVGCRFTGAEPRTFTNTAHVFLRYCRAVVIVGNTFRRGADLPYDYSVNGAAAPGPHRGIITGPKAERCVIVGNDLQFAGTVACIEVYHDTPGDAQLVIQGNRLDGTEVLSPVYFAPVDLWGIQRQPQNYWDNPFYLGTHALWVDDSGRLRIKNGTPTSQADGTVVGTQT